MTTADRAPGLPRRELCGGGRIGDISLVGRVGPHPTSRAVGAGATGGVDAVVRLDCGHTGFFASDPGKLRDEAEEHPEAFIR